MSVQFLYGASEWFSRNEFIAIWLEGAALVAIFVWDRIDSHHQHKDTINQLKVLQEQVEASQKPCLVFSTAARPAEEAILAPDGETMMLRCPESQAQIENVGTGPAVNARYSLTPVDLASTVARPSGYLVWMVAGGKFLTPIPRGILQGNEWVIVVAYESLSGYKYRTTTTVRNLVLTDIKFERIPQQFDNPNPA
jgi:hypothetical protein